MSREQNKKYLFATMLIHYVPIPIVLCTALVALLSQSLGIMPCAIKWK